MVNPARARARRLRVAALGATVVAAAVVIAACDDGAPAPASLELCAWIADPTSCYRSLHLAVEARCGAPGVAGDDFAAAPVGAFAMRSSLVTCDLENGGTVTFDPPLDLNDFPLGQPLEDPDGGPPRPPDTYNMLLVAPGPDGGPAPSPTLQDECAMLRVSSARDFGLSFGRLQFSITTQGPEATVTCSGEGQSAFDLDELAACPDLAPLMPRVEVDSNPGSGEAPGWVRLRVVYPPSELDADGTLDATKVETVEYFNCAIPPRPPLCLDGLLDGNETDVDCGGPADGGCPARCLEGGVCKIDEDCASPLVCQVDQAIGIALCTSSSDAGAAGP